MAKFTRQASEATLVAKVTQQQLLQNEAAYNQGLFKFLRLLVHLLAASQFWYGVYCQFKIHMPVDSVQRSSEELVELKNSHWGGKFKFLTFLNAILQAVYHSVALLNDIFGSNELVPKSGGLPSILRKTRDYLFAALAFPLTGIVSISFWLIYAYDRELVFPTALDAIFPNWLNHVVHTNVAMMIILDMFTCFRQYPTRSRNLAGILSFLLTYLVWIHVVKHFSGRWVYPLLEVLNTPMRYTVMGALGCFTVFLYFVGEWLNGIIWGQELELLRRKQYKVQ